MNHLTTEQQALLILVRRSLWSEQLELPENINWEQVGVIAKEQGVVSFAYDGAVKAKAPVPGELLQKWQKMMLYGALTNERLLQAQDELLQCFGQADIPAVILKGSSVARYYPQPELRVLGDIDVLVQKSDLEKAGEILQEHGYALCEHDHDFHIAYKRKDAYVELHQEVTRFPDNMGGAVAKEICSDFLQSICKGTIEKHSFSVLSETNQALSLILHMVRHMFGKGIGLRQMCDWAAFITGTDQAYFEACVIPVLERCGLMQYTKVVTKTCIDYLGMPGETMLWCKDVGTAECRAVMMDVFSTGSMGVADQGLKISVLQDRHTAETKQRLIPLLIRELTNMSYQKFPVTKKCKILLPFVWVFLPLRYWLRSLLGKRKKKSFFKMMQSAKEQRDLQDTLQLFVTDQ